MNGRMQSSSFAYSFHGLLSSYTTQLSAVEFSRWFIAKESPFFESTHSPVNLPAEFVVVVRNPLRIGLHWVISKIARTSCMRTMR